MIQIEEYYTFFLEFLHISLNLQLIYPFLHLDHLILILEGLHFEFLLFFFLRDMYYYLKFLLLLVYINLHIVHFLHSHDYNQKILFLHLYNLFFHQYYNQADQQVYQQDYYLQVYLWILPLMTQQKFGLELMIQQGDLGLVIQQRFGLEFSRDLG